VTHWVAQQSRAFCCNGYFRQLESSVFMHCLFAFTFYSFSKCFYPRPFANEASSVS